MLLKGVSGIIVGVGVDVGGVNLGGSGTVDGIGVDVGWLGRWFRRGQCVTTCPSSLQLRKRVLQRDRKGKKERKEERESVCACEKEKLEIQVFVKQKIKSEINSLMTSDPI